MEPCPLCSPAADRVLLESEAAYALTDSSRTEESEVVVVPGRHVARVDRLTQQEHDDVLDLVEEVREGLGGRKGDSAWGALKSGIGNLLKGAKEEFSELGGWAAMRSGEWLWELIQKSFQNFWERANVDYFFRKYGTHDKKKIRGVLVAVAAKNGAALGAVTGAAVTADEVTALVTAGEGVVGLPTNIAIAATAMGAEAILLLRIELQLLANLGKLYGVSLDADDPEDILTILAFSVGGSAAEAAGKFGMKVGAKVAERAVKGVFRKDLLAALKRIAAKIGVKVLQRSIVRYTVPAVSIGIGAGWNYFSVKAVAKVACRHFEARGGKLE